MKKLSIYILSLLFVCTLFTSCEIDDEGGYIQQYNLHGIWWAESWDDEYGEIHEQQLFFDYSGRGTEHYIVHGPYGYQETYYFNWEWLDDRTVIMYFEDGDISRFDIYELNGFLLRGRLGNNSVYFTPR
ncbi:MAG: hypothetical protein LUE98_03115 [Tannerellaceae bacterium]|nr:hypothetical protein [Tannerellaceae bacterium]